MSIPLLKVSFPHFSYTVNFISGRHKGAYFTPVLALAPSPVYLSKTRIVLDSGSLCYYVGRVLYIVYIYYICLYYTFGRV